MTKHCLVILTLILILPLSGAASDRIDLEAGFRQPPPDSGIRCFWWWLNSNVTKEAITRDLEEMKAKGFSGALIFDADGSSQRGNNSAPAGPVFGSEDWTRLFVHACREADRLGLELSLNLQSGWNLGGPSVTPAEATQRLVWSSTTVKGPARVTQALPMPKHKDFYQDLVVLALPVGQTSNSTSAHVQAIQASSTQFSADLAMDGNSDSYWVSQQGPSLTSPQWLLLKLSEPVTLSRLTVQGRKGYGPRKGRIQLALDQNTFHTVKDFTLRDGEQLTVDFEPKAALYLRLLFTRSYDRGMATDKSRNVQVAEITLPGVRGALNAANNPIKHLNLKSSTRELGGSAPDCRYLLETSPAVPGEVAVKLQDILNLSDKMDTEGFLHWEVPHGQWQLLRFGHTEVGAHVSTCHPGWQGRVLDYMNPASLRRYWDRHVTPLLEAIGPLTGKVLRYVHTDSWEGGGMNWTPGFARSFQENRGYDPLPWLAVLTGHVVDSREASNAFLADFRKTIGDRIADHYGLLAELARAHGMGTHPECSGPHAGPLDGLKNYGRSELMMSEFWSPSPHRPTPEKRFFVKQASSAAHTYGQRLVGAEGFTTIGPHWNDVPWSQMKPSFDTEFCAGLNMVFVHTFTCSPLEMGLPGQEYFAGTHFNPQITWWDESVTFIDYLRRCQYLAQQGRFVADVLYYYGDHIPNIARLKADDPAGALPGYDYDVLSEELLLDDLQVKEGRLVLSSGMRYRVLVLPDHKILSLGALRKIDNLVRAGATVLGSKPRKAVSLEGGKKGISAFQQLADGLWGSRTPDAPGSRTVDRGRVVWGMPARELLQADGLAYDLAITDKQGGFAREIDWIHYRIGQADVYFLAELAGEAREVVVHCRVTGQQPELWNAVDGSIRMASCFTSDRSWTSLPLHLAAYDSLFIVFCNPTSTTKSIGTSNALVWQGVQEIAGFWEVRFDPNWGGPEQAVRLETLVDWTTLAQDEIKNYSGKAQYRTRFELSGDIDGLGPNYALELGRIVDVGIARVTLNGQDLGIVWRPPFRCKITQALKAGTNTLEVTVVNSWVNRLLADSELPQEQRLTKTNITIQKKGRFQINQTPSGLLGPVRIVRMVE